MPGRWKPPKSERTDLEAIRCEQQFQRDLSGILDHGSEDDFVKLLKWYKPQIGKEELQEAVRQFYVYAREKRGLC